MQSVKYLLKLYEIPSECGQISAFDTHTNTIFAGTDNGTLLKLSVEGALPSYSSSQLFRDGGDRTADECDGHEDGGLFSQVTHSESNPHMAASSEIPKKINTMLLNRTLLSPTGRGIERIQHSRTHHLLFVLIEHRLVVLNSVNFSQIQTISENVGTFYVSDSQQGSTQRVGVHVICASELNGRRLSVFEFDPLEGEHACAVLAQELVLPEPVQVLVTYGGIACVGMRREYALLSLSDGTTCSVLSLVRGRRPLLAVGDGEVFMRYNHSIFSVSMRSMPSDRVLGRTIQLKDEALSFVVRHPFLFIFTENYCDVCSLYDEGVFERLPLPGCLFTSQLGRGDFLYAASSTKIWMVALHSLRHQLADLVESFKVEEAFHLLGSQRARTSLDWQEIELELHIMAGFALLHHCRPKEAMLHFNDHVDPRDLLLLVPECIPPAPEEYSPELHALLNEQKLRKHRGRSANQELSLTELVTQNVKHSCNESNKGEKGMETETIRRERDDDDSGYWAQWEGRCPYNVYAGELHRAWVETYETFPLVPRMNGDENQPALRQVVEWGAVTVTGFLDRAWEQLKDELILYFRLRLSQASDAYARAMEYALLVLALEAQDHRAAYRVVTCGSSLRVEDCYDLLSSLREYRLLACLLHARGCGWAAKDVLTSRVYVSALLPPPAVGMQTTEELAPSFGLLPKEMRAKLARLLHSFSTSSHRNDTPSLTFGEEGALNQTSFLTLVPPSLSEAMYLVSKLSLPALQELLRENPQVSLTVDEEGCSLLHVLFSLLVLLEDSEKDVVSESGKALLNMVLSCAVLLLDYGASVAVLNAQGLSCLDVVALVADGVFLDIVVATLLADGDVKDVVATVNQDDSVATICGF